MTTKDVVWAMRVRSAHNSSHDKKPMNQCGTSCQIADALLNDDERIKRNGGIR